MKDIHIIFIQNFIVSFLTTGRSWYINGGSPGTKSTVYLLAYKRTYVYICGYLWSVTLAKGYVTYIPLTKGQICKYKGYYVYLILSGYLLNVILTKGYYTHILLTKGYLTLFYMPKDIKLTYVDTCKYKGYYVHHILSGYFLNCNT